jgi:hypothetical protein
MASAKRTPKVSRITRDRTVAYARKQKPGDKAASADEPADAEPASAEAASASAEAGSGAASAEAAAVTGPEDLTSPADLVTRPMTAAPPPVSEAPAVSAAPPAREAPAVSEAPPVSAPPAEPTRARAATVLMPVQASIGAPPAMPAGAAVAAAPVDPEIAEAPTHMPGPREIPGGSPDDPGAPPGRVPPGDSRSMRRRADTYEFALIYRIQTYVICRFGAVGRRGVWRVVEYPTSASASHAYAKEVSRFVSEGFSDYRD